MTSGSLLITLLLNYWSSPILYIIKVFIIKEEHFLKPVITLPRREEYLTTFSFLYLTNISILQSLTNISILQSLTNSSILQSLTNISILQSLINFILKKSF